jgi:hypothetical protein
MWLLALSAATRVSRVLKTALKLDRERHAAGAISASLAATASFVDAYASFELGGSRWVKRLDILSAMRSFVEALSIAAICFTSSSLAKAEETRLGVAEDVMGGLLANQPAIPTAAARERCLTLPIEPADDRLQTPHGDVLLSTDCIVLSYQSADEGGLRGWRLGHYGWTSVFTAEDASRGADARDTIVEEEVVVLQALGGHFVRPLWRWRFDLGSPGTWRSVTPELARIDTGGALLSVTFCVNGTGGCSQEFALRSPDGRWRAVRQAWLNQLPQGYVGRIRHGARIDPYTLEGEAGFYGEDDPNCCPSQRLVFRLRLNGESLHAVARSDAP